MQERTSRLQKAVAYALLLIGLLGIGLLVYVVVDRLAFSAPAISSQANLEPSISDAIPSEPEVTAGTEATEEKADVAIGIRIGQRAPDFHLQSLDNEDVALSDFLGQVVILDFWASWCGPCKSTMPRLEDFAREMAPDVVLLGVSVDRNATDASDYLASNNFDAMIALYESYAAAFSVSLTYAVSGIPKTYVIDRDGIIRYVGHPAVLPRQTIERLL